MWDYMGIVRTTRRLERALRRINLLQQEIDEYYRHFRLSNNLLELRNLVQVADLMVRCAHSAPSGQRPAPDSVAPAGYWRGGNDDNIHRSPAEAG